MEAAGAINVYQCATCGHKTVTVNLAEGVTPMFINCRSEQFCKGVAHSKMYRVPQDLTPTHEWYRPSRIEAKQLNGLDHWAGGGLWLRQKRDKEQIEYEPGNGVDLFGVSGIGTRQGSTSARKLRRLRRRGLI